MLVKAEHACEDGFDPIEDRLRSNIRTTIEAVFEEELDGFLGRLRYSRRILVLSECLVLFENPWADHPLPDRARRFAERLPCFNFGHSICNCSPGDAEKLAELGRRQIEAMNQWREVLDAH